MVVGEQLQKHSCASQDHNTDPRCRKMSLDGEQKMNPKDLL